MSDTREQIRMRLWVDTYNYWKMFGTDPAVTYAKLALESFDAQFPPEESLASTAEDLVECFCCGGKDRTANMYSVGGSWFCKTCRNKA